MLKRFVYASFVTLAACSQSFGAIVYSTNFDGPLYTDGALATTVGVDGQDGWRLTAANTTNPVSVANALTNGTVTIAATGQDVFRAFAPAATPANSSSVSLAATLSVLTTQGAGDYFLHLGDGGTTNFFARLFARPSVNAGFFNMSMSTSSGASTFGADLPLNTQFSLLARYDFVTGAANDTGELFINGISYVAATTVGTDAASISSVNIRQGGNTTGPTVRFESLSVDVTAVPEPTSMVLLGVAGVAGLAVRYRRNNAS